MTTFIIIRASLILDTAIVGTKGISNNTIWLFNFSEESPKNDGFYSGLLTFSNSSFIFSNEDNIVEIVFIENQFSLLEKELGEYVVLGMFFKMCDGIKTIGKCQVLEIARKDKTTSYLS